MSANKRQLLRRLPEEITEIILVRLPADDLGRFKLVCKDWRSLISSPSFISAHIKHSQSDPSNHHILLDADDWILGEGLFRSVICCVSSAANIVGSVNGLICVARTFRDGGSPDEIWILNPLTGHSIKLPPPPSPLDLTLCEESRVTFAFWCDPVTNAYKVARIVSHLYTSDFHSEGFDCNPDYPNPNRADVWDSSSPETWSEIRIGFDRPFYHPLSWVTGCDIVVGGCAYWIVVDFNKEGLFVLSLDMDTLLLKPISLPRLSMSPKLLIECLVLCRSFLFVTNWKGRFALVARKENWTGDVPYFDKKEVGDMHNIWTTEDGSSGTWNPPISLHLDFLTGYLLKYINGKLFLWRAPYDRITLYDMETQSFEVLALGIDGVSLVSAHDFVGSFATINGFKPVGPDISQLLTFV